MEIKTLEIGKVCPVCGSSQFSIIPVDRNLGYPGNWPKGTLGVSDCGGCHQTFFLKLPGHLRSSVRAMIEEVAHTAGSVPQALRGVLTALFPVE
jgi:hypothetical protein